MSTRAGFSLIEVVVSMLILSVGVLAMGASTGYVLNQVRYSELTTERSVAIREVSEQLRATDWSAVESVCANAVDVGRYTVTCTVRQAQKHLKEVRLVSVGPGFGSGTAIGDVADTTAIVLAEPLD